MESFPQVLLFPLVGSFLDILDLSRCQAVSRSWRRLGRRWLVVAQQQQRLDDWNARQQTLACRSCARQQGLLLLQADSVVQNLDRQVAVLAVRIFYKRYPLTERQALFQTLKAKLHAGGQLRDTDAVRIATEQNERFMALLQDSDRTVEENMLALGVWRELMLAGLRLWHLYSFPQWLVGWVCWGGSETKPSFHERWEAWRLLRLIMMTQKERLEDRVDFQQFCRDSTPLIWRSDNKLELPSRPLDLWFAGQYLQFVLPCIDFGFFLRECISTKLHYLLLLVAGDDDNCSIPTDVLMAHLNWSALLDTIWSDKSLQKFFRQRLVRLPGLCRQLMCRQEILAALCHRKDRHTFELLFQMAPQTMVSVGIPNALRLLSTKVRGKKERLVDFFCAIQWVGRQKEQVLRELCG